MTEEGRIKYLGGRGSNLIIGSLNNKYINIENLNPETNSAWYLYNNAKLSYLYNPNPEYEKAKETAHTSYTDADSYLNGLKIITGSINENATKILNEAKSALDDANKGIKSREPSYENVQKKLTN